MKPVLNKIHDLIVQPMSDLEIIVCDIDYVTENNYHFLKITLDKINGLDLDTIVAATKIINPILDEYDLINEEYVLDISSKERG